MLEIASKVKGVGPVVTPFEQFYEFWEGSFPEITVEIFLKNGTKFSKTLRFPKGHPKNRMGWDELKDRFRLQASVVLKPERVEKAIGAIRNLENIDDMSEIGNLMHN